jgi:hypothetical protein
MKTIRRYIFDSLAVALLAGCIGSGAANAQSVTGKFSLDLETHWNGVTLPPGSYSFRFDRPLGATILTCGKKHVGMVLAQSVDAEASSQSSLMLEEVDGVISVRELRLPDSDLILRYPAAKAGTGKAIETRRLVPVAAQAATIKRVAPIKAPLSGAATGSVRPRMDAR